MQKYAAIVLIIFLCNILPAQNISYIQSATSGDSSYYDIFALNNNEFWIGGKHGILNRLDSTGNISKVSYPGEGEHILNINAFNENKIIVTADKGVLYLHDRKTNTWEKKRLQQFSGRTFYSIQIVNDSVAFICGGSSQVSFGQKAIPWGFILKSSDQGKSWEKVYSSPFHMVWDLTFDAKSNRIYASLFSPLGGKIISSNSEHINWQSEKIEGNNLFHSISYRDNNLILAGMETGTKRDKGILIEKIKLEFKEVAGFWSYNFNEYFEVLTSSGGTFLFKAARSANYNIVKTEIPLNLYEAAFINDRQLFIIGSRQTILKIDLQAAPLSTHK